MRNIDPSLIALLDQVRKTYESIPERFKNENVSILTQVVAGLVSGVCVKRGWVYGEAEHIWLEPLTNKGLGVDYVIDICPINIHPGPIIVRLTKEMGTSWYKKDHDFVPNGNDNERIAEIVDATEGARRFLSMP